MGQQSKWIWLVMALAIGLGIGYLVGHSSGLTQGIARGTDEEKARQEEVVRLAKKKAGEEAAKAVNLFDRIKINPYSKAPANPYEGVKINPF